MEQLTAHDIELLEMAYETTYKRSLETYIAEADTELCKRMIASYMRMYKDYLE